MELNRRTFFRRMAIVAVGVNAGCVGVSDQADSGTPTQKSGSPTTVEDPDPTTADTPTTTPTETTRSETESSEPTDTRYETTSIPILKSGDEVVATEQVPADWKEQVDRAEQVLRRVQAEYGDIEGIRQTSLVSAEGTIGELHYSAVRVGVAPSRVGQVDEQISDQINNVSVNVVLQEHTPVNLSVSGGIEVNTTTESEP